MSSSVYTSARIFTGENWLTDHAIITSDGVIKDIVPLSALHPSQDLVRFDEGIIAPAFIDLQIYGAGGKLFTVYPGNESLELLAAHNRNTGTAYCLPTVATNTKKVFFECIDAIRNYWKDGGKGILGLHLEGPWINRIKRGAHVETLVHAPSIQEVEELVQYGKGVIRFITLAPEVCSDKVISLLQENGIIISAGHSNAGYAEAKKRFDRGIRLVTHLFNAMSGLQHRDPGLAAAAMEDQRVMASIIPDGHHVDFAMLRIAKKLMGERLFVITDAVTDTSEGHYQHRRAGDKFESAGVLSGSAISMNQALKNLVNHCEIDPGEALRMCSYYPARALGLDNKIGIIRKAASAEMIVLDQELNYVHSIN